MIQSVTLRAANGVKENCLQFDDELRIASIHLRKSDFGRAYMSHERFIDFLTETYNLPKMKRGGDLWHYKNETESWKINYHTLSNGILEISR